MRSSRVGLSVLLAIMLLLAAPLASAAGDRPQAAGSDQALAAVQESTARDGSGSSGSPGSLSPAPAAGFHVAGGASNAPVPAQLSSGLSSSALLTSGAPFPGAAPPPILFRHAGVDACRAARIAQAAAGRLLFQGTSRASDNIDVVSYTITMEVDFEAESVDARCDVGVRSMEAGLTQFSLDLVGLTVTGVMEDFSAAVAFAHEGAELQITPSTPMALDEERVYSISYNGVPENGIFFSGQNQGTCFSFSEPEDARFWFPCRDIPSDKADWYRGHITVPTGKLVASNGDLEGTQDNGDGTTTFDYFHDYPISTYLISLAISPYATFDQSASGGVDLTHYVYPAQLEDAIYDWANTPAMIDFYSATYEPYPFPTYGMACAPIGGAMEHQTMTTMDPGLIDGNRGGESVVAHELSHMWWGDMITCGDWPNIWLNEGFASYFDALFTEHFYGAEAFRAQMISSRLSYLYWEPYEGRFPIFDPDYMWGGTVYDKGSWILHMLRDVIGQADFVATMQLYADRFRYGAARTEDFIAAAEDASGEDLGWFFDEWVYKAGYPEIEYEWTYAGGTASVTVRQVQVVDDITPLYTMPLDIALITSSGTVETTVTMDQASETFPVAVPAAPIRVILDPHLVLLSKIYGPDGLVAGPGPDDDNPCAVRTFDGWAAPLGPEIVPYGVDRWGAKVGGGDLDGDGVDEVLTGPGPGAMFGPHVRGFEVAGSPLPGLSFLAYGTHKYGVNVTAGNLDADAREEIITGAGPGAVFGPHVRGWNYSGSSVSPMSGVSFLAYGTHKWGVNVAAGDIDGDGYDEIVTGAGPGAVFGPHVRGWNVDGGAATAIPAVSFLAYGTHRWGVNVACGDLDADGMDEIITAPGPGEEFAPHIRAFNYDGVAITPMPEVNFFGFGYGYGAQVAAADLNGDRADELIVAAGPAPQAPPYVLTFTLNADGEIELIFYIEAFSDTSRGLHVAGLRSVVGQ